MTKVIKQSSSRVSPELWLMCVCVEEVEISVDWFVLSISVTADGRWDRHMAEKSAFFYILRPMISEKEEALSVMEYFSCIRI